MMQTQVAIVGGGLTGLALAHQLQRAGVAFELFEARDRFGGRIKAFESAQGRVDLGPSWFWPGQPRIAALIDTLGLAKFAQYDQGALSFEDVSGSVQRGMGYASMSGSWRLEGSLVALIDALVSRLSPDRLHLRAEVAQIARSDAGVQITLAGGQSCSADQVVLAVPPRIAQALPIAPALTPAQLSALDAIPTWMAGHAKFVAVYDRAFWRDEGLSGDAMSRRGPLMEIHDASGRSGQPAALFGFFGLDARTRHAQQLTLPQVALDQLARFFGPRALSPLAHYLQDWAREPLTARPRDIDPLRAHPDYGLPAVLAGLWEGRLQFASSETAPEMGGYMEGALAAAERVAAKVQSTYFPGSK